MTNVAQIGLFRDVPVPSKNKNEGGLDCSLTGPVYNKFCAHCMKRKIIDLRSYRAPKVAKRLQDDALAFMGVEMAAKVLAALRCAK